MIKNGRPYTNENGFTDGALITGREDAVVTAVDGWIRKNIRAGKKVLQGHTSYGMKHLLEHDTGVYLTNNEFKDAMLLAGYRAARSEAQEYETIRQNVDALLSAPEAQEQQRRHELE